MSEPRKQIGEAGEGHLQLLQLLLRATALAWQCLGQQRKPRLDGAMPPKPKRARKRRAIAEFLGSNAVRIAIALESGVDGKHNVNLLNATIGNTLAEEGRDPQASAFEWQR